MCFIKIIFYNPNMPLSDVDIIVHGCSSATYDSYLHLIPQLRSLPLKQGRFDFNFKFCERPTLITDTTKAFSLQNGKTVTKLRDCWDTTFVSDKPMQKHEYYFEIEMAVCGESGTYIGVTTDPVQARFGGNLVAETTSALYNTDNGNFFSKEFVHVTRSVRTTNGAVIGVVVDRSGDAFKFYLDGVQVGVGDKKPSELRGDLYAFVSIFYQNHSVRVCEKFPFQKLK